MYVSWKFKKIYVCTFIYDKNANSYFFYYCFCIEANAVEDHYGCEVLYINTVLSNIFK